ncbi:hypothetical protein SHI21_08370 [Bacteriovorax sp. PP10]|uniref:Uncharacterized protein n=1 Tax=Bacteriovorax antarcticus TaxID=3088717 RepID=A0ABU5VUY6_9BACT|nr:hypothetical protein [Bacteriovorax sp. PP10]MEA9356213.1 hypothetical protein [Bacteriovorax sp. PP10]
MKRQFKIGETELVHYYKPGENLDDISLKNLHNSLVRINEESGANVVNKMLDKKLTLTEIRNHLKNTIIGIVILEDSPAGFLLSPILSSINNKPVIHAGLVVISKNPGANCVGLLAYGNYCMVFEILGPIYATNISSTPSIIEDFVTMIPDSWPSPDVNLKVAPKNYKDVVKILKDEYMDNYFPDPGKLDVNYKRFILTSNSQDMGFTTDFHKISRSNDLKYMLFCQAWVNYNKEEDIIQVGEISLYGYMRMKYYIFMMKRGLKKAEIGRAREREMIRDIVSSTENKKAA